MPTERNGEGASRQRDGSDVNANDDFRLSRIQAEGWNAARRVPVARLAQLDGEKIAALNPYRSDPEQTRWKAGFANALASWHR